LAKGFKSYNLFASPYANPSDAKLRYSDFYGGYVVVTTSSSGFVGVIDYETGECLFERNSNSSGENNPHAIELLPDGNVVVASSAGNSVTVYAATTGDGNGYYKRYTLRDAHGLVWDPTLKVLWALGYDELVAYEIGTDASEPVLTAKEGMTYTTPEIGGHDLYTVYGDSNLLWVTVHENIYQFDKETGTFATSEVLSDVQTLNVKSIGTQPFSGDIVCLIPNGAYASWDSDVVDWFANDGNGQYTKESRQSAGAYYKARVWYYKYQ
jgi:WD40 repeat protein